MSVFVTFVLLLVFLGDVNSNSFSYREKGRIGKGIGTEMNVEEAELFLLKRLLRRNKERKEEEATEELEREQRDNTVHATLFLERFGYLPVMKEGVQHEPEDRKKAIKNFQHMYHIPQTGEMDSHTIQMMKAPRCGMPDVVPREYLNASLTRSRSSAEVKTQLIAANYFVPGYKWDKHDLTWNLKNYNQQLDPTVTKNALRRAFQYWSDASSLRFGETQDKGDINMQFASGSHSDGPQNAFDGPGGVLAHAFYPPSGETHFDDQEQWTDGKKEGINLMIVATHELGHALGLGHSNVEGSLMAPYYQGYDPAFKLPDDDTRAIQSIYGPPGFIPSTTTTTTTSKPINPGAATTRRTTIPAHIPDSDVPPNTCDFTFKAITQTHDYRIYVYYGRWMWRTSEYGLDQGFPMTISTYYENPPENIDAAIFSWSTYYTYFFKGNQVWRYYGFQLVDSKSLDRSGFPESPNAAILASDGNIYLIKDGTAYPFDENAYDMKAGVAPKSLQQLFPNSPTHFDSLVHLMNDKLIYFFQGNNYIKYNQGTQQVEAGYPKPKAGPWFGKACGALPYTPK